ncbi:MAG: sulfatase-like hydrolase/transferase [Planctomycetota bacterium]
MTRQTEVPVDVRRSLSLAYGRALYDAEVRYVDGEIDRLFDRLKAMEIYDDALIVIMADHGENMGTDSELHGSVAFSHKRLWEGVAHTPLIVRLPNQKEGHRIDALVQNIDVAPTILELLGLPADQDAEGKSLLPLLRDTGGTLHQRVFIESSDHVERAIKTDEYKYVSPGPGQEPMLFRYRDDPSESIDVTEEVPQTLLDTFARELDEFRPKESMHVRFKPDVAPYAAAFDLELEGVEFRAAVVLGGEGQTVMSDDKKRLTVEVQVGLEPVDVVIGTQRRNARLDWAFRMEDANGVPLVADAIADRVFLGPLPIRRSHALPHWRPTVDENLAPPERPAMELSRVEKKPAFELVLRSPKGDPQELSTEMRYRYPGYTKGIEVESSEGFGELEANGGLSFTLKAEGESAAARLLHHPRDGQVRFLSRIGGEPSGNFDCH